MHRMRVKTSRIVGCSARLSHSVCSCSSGWCLTVYGRCCETLCSHSWSCQGLGNDACLARCHRLVWTVAACYSDKKHIQARTMGSGEAGLDLSLCSLFVSRPPVFFVFCLTVLLGLRSGVIIGLNTDPCVVFLELL